jgi:Zn-finger nucleic acid-binding protein
MSNSWDDMRRAKEESYFDKKNREALERLAQKQAAQNQGEAARKSPITGEAMLQEVIHGVVIDRCPTSGGVWLDAGELEQLLEAAVSEDHEQRASVTGFLKSLVGK